jgi:hemolysin III
MSPDRVESPGEERANAWSAAAGLAGALTFLVLLVLARPVSPGQIVFALALLALFFASTVYHVLPHGPLKRIARVLDHAAIFVLIAGTYTPFAAGPLRHAGGGWLLLIEWTMAALGVGFVLLGGMNFRRLSNALYIAMGWAGLMFLPDFLRHVGAHAMAWIVAGGVVYTAGVVFYSARSWRYSHFAWHLFVLVGAACHAYAVAMYC